MSLDGLANKLANDPALRKQILENDSLTSWPDVDLIGVCQNVNAQRMNSHLLKVIADHWCPQWESPVMIPVDEAKNEAGVTKANRNLQIVNSVF